MLVRAFSWSRAGVSNTRPAGRMWPAWRVNAALVIIKIHLIIDKTKVLWGTSLRFGTIVGRGGIFAYLCVPRALFSSKCGPRIHLSLRPLVQNMVWHPGLQLWYNYVIKTLFSFQKRRKLSKLRIAKSRIAMATCFIRARALQIWFMFMFFKTTSIF